MITVEYCGYHTHNPDRDIILRPYGSESYLFLLILSPMTFYFQNHNPVKVKPGACILYSPGKYQHYQAENEFFNSYVHFYCKPEDIRGYEIKKNHIFYPDNTEDLNWLLKKIYQEFINGLSKSEDMLDLYVRELFVLLHRGRLREVIPDEQRKGIYPELLSLRQQVLGNCEQPWSVEQMCRILNIGKSQLYKYYEDFFHSTPKKELVQARLQKAKYLLKNDAVTVNQAAYESGFNNICYFNRMFKLQCGCTPGEYRGQKR